MFQVDSRSRSCNNVKVILTGFKSIGDQNHAQTTASHTEVSLGAGVYAKKVSRDRGHIVMEAPARHNYSCDTTQLFAS